MDLLKQLYNIPSKSGKESRIKSFILDYLKDLDLSIETDDFGNIFMTKGIADIYPCITAHLDEVHDIEERIIVEEDGIIYATNHNGERVGLCADD